MARLRERGVGAILDYAAEDDSKPAEQAQQPQHVQQKAEQQPEQQHDQQQQTEQQQLPTPQELGRRRAVARMYCYQSELLCDK